MTNEKLKENAEAAIDVLFADQSVSQQKTLENIQAIIDHCEPMCVALLDDLEKKEKS